MYSIFGASLLSASASLPLHLLPLLILLVAQEDRLPLAWVGWLGSAYMVGQLFAALALPALRVDRISRAYAFAAVVGLLLVLGLSGTLTGVALLASWAVVGLVCGTLHFLATTAAAAVSDRRRAFAVRMAMSSLVAAVVIAGLQLAKGIDAYATLSIQLTLAFGLLAAIGLSLYRSPAAVGKSARAKGDSKSALPVSQTKHLFGRASGLGVLFVLFVGQHGLWAFAAQHAQGRGVPLDHLAYAIAACKFVAGAVVLASAFRPVRAQLSPAISLCASGAAVAVGVVGVGWAREFWFFWAGLLFWEVGFSALSARLQALAAQDNPRVAGMWMTGAIFTGAATGPALGGLVVHAGYFGAYAVFAIVTALVPVAWFRMRTVKSLV